MALLATVTFEASSLLPEDRVVNTFPVLNSVGFGDEDQWNGLAEALREFYNDPVAPAAIGLSRFMAAHLSRAVNGVKVRFYNIGLNLSGLSIEDGGIPSGSPIHETSFTLGDASGGFNLQDEVAMVLRVEATGRADAPVEVPDGVDPGSLLDRPKQRHTGRIYIGPLHSSCIVTAGGVQARPASTFITALVEAADRLYSTVVTSGTGNSRFGVWSRADAAIRSVESVGTDDAFDTQRRRGAKPLAFTRRDVVYA